ncbi:chorismate-binding protein [Actinocatenispora rupis]|uniref:Aminodeoxychorismate synthase component I n=1 Tax=Actinocatenispora rupis TaxID=519421 RepID=A0A8J3J039_9ACTN|nr:chorismate-binding protein [Actinocatenispora rupis]GID12060.1 aminodeoxychorismate synthase component I [Actinocatenispora rupis]
MLRRLLAEHEHVVVLRGAWRAGRTVVALRPVRYAPAGADPFRLLRDTPAADPGAGVCGGWFGTLRYDLGERRHRAPVGCRTGDLAYVDRVLRQRHDGEWELAGLTPLGRAETDRYRELVRTAVDGAAPGWSLGPLSFRPRADHLAAVRRCVELISAGELFQANVAIRLSGRFTGDAAEAYLAVDGRLTPARGALVRLGGPTVLSASPELYLDRDGDTVSSAPIKGTAPRTGGAAALRRSVKDRAENVMIVDLVRNDLGRVAERGSVVVPDLLEVAGWAGTRHLVSRVTATVPAAVDTGTVLAETFPPGSVTGCPKLAALDTIDELEPVSRGVYTGAVGYLAPGRRSEWNVAIRTAEIAGERLEVGVGGGITVGSDPAAEWAECWTKAAPLLHALRAGPLPVEHEGRRAARVTARTSPA